MSADDEDRDEDGSELAGMARHHNSLIAQIESDALDDNVPVASALRKCSVLGGKSGSEKLRDWATRELQGYPGVEDLPSYRAINAPLLVDGIRGNYKVTRQPFPPMSLPDFAREHITEEVKAHKEVSGASKRSWGKHRST